MRYAGFWRRFAALIIDDIIIWGFLLGAGRVVATPAYLGHWGVDFWMRASYLSLGASVGPLLYFWLMTAYLGQTVGKMALSIKVVNPAGQPPGLGWALLRETVGKFLSSLFCGLGFVWVAFDSDKQGWHDKIARTYVVVARRAEVDAAAGAPPS